MISNSLSSVEDNAGQCMSFEFSQSILSNIWYNLCLSTGIKVHMMCIDFLLFCNWNI